MHKILRKHQAKISYEWAMINRSLRNIGLSYIQPLKTCLVFSCPLILCFSISCHATSCPANLSKFVLHFHVHQFHAWTLGPSISRPSFSAPSFTLRTVSKNDDDVDKDKTSMWKLRRSENRTPNHLARNDHVRHESIGLLERRSGRIKLRGNTRQRVRVRYLYNVQHC